jgi:hypothetical protein
VHTGAARLADSNDDAVRLLDRCTRHRLRWQRKCHDKTDSD